MKINQKISELFENRDLALIKKNCAQGYKFKSFLEALSQTLRFEGKSKATLKKMFVSCQL